MAIGDKIKDYLNQKIRDFTGYVQKANSNPQEPLKVAENFSVGAANRAVDMYQNTFNNLANIGSKISGMQTGQADFSPIKKTLFPKGSRMFESDRLYEGIGGSATDITANVLGGKMLSQSPVTNPLINKAQKIGGMKAGKLIGQGKILQGRGIANVAQGLPYTVAGAVQTGLEGGSPLNIAANLAGDFVGGATLFPPMVRGTNTVDTAVDIGRKVAKIKPNAWVRINKGGGYSREMPVRNIIKYLRGEMTGGRLNDPDVVELKEFVKKHPEYYYASLKADEGGFASLGAFTGKDADKIPGELLNNDIAGQLFMELDNAYAGTRNATENGTVGIKSGFPQWVPENLREKKLFEKVYRYLVDDSVPPLKNKKEWELYGVIHSRLRRLNGIVDEPITSPKGVEVPQKMQATNTSLPGQRAYPDASTTSPQGAKPMQAVQSVGSKVEVPYTNNITPPVKKLKVGNTTSEYNVGRIKTQNPEAVSKAVDEVAPRVEKIVGGPITRDQVKVLADTANERVVKTVGRGQAERLQASQLSLRKKIANLADATASGNATPKQIKELNDAMQRDITTARSIAQQLSARNIDATPSTPEGRLLAEMLANIQKVTDDMDKVNAAMRGVDFSDADQATNFYRQFVKPSLSEWNDMLRYNSMLSSPNTHIVNATSNLQGTSIVAPIEKTITGALDWMGATVTGGQRKYYAGEGPAYAKGYIGSAGKAWDNFVKTLSGKNISAMQTDSRNIPLTKSGTIARVVEDVLSSPTKMLQAADEFFQTLTEGGVTSSLKYRASKGTAVNDLGTKALDEGRKRLFNADITQQGEGYLLDSVSKLAGLVMQARNSKNPIVSTVSKFSMPFVRVATNIMKQGIEYSPAGVLTLPGNATKTEQLAKMLMGTTVAITAGSLLSSDRMTWSTPTDPKKRALWESAGLQPYAIKVGDKWYSYNKLHPVLSFNLALVAAIKDAESNKRISEDKSDAIMNGFAKWIQFQADQSYVKSISDLVAALQGDPTGMARLASNAPSQEIPFRGLLSWINRFIDDTQRKADPNADFIEKQYQYIAMQIPGLSQTVPARMDENGNPIKYTNKEINAISPIRVTTENSDMKALYDAAVEKSRKTKMDNDLKSMLKGEMKPADGINIQTSSTGARYIINGNELKYTDEEGSVKNIDLTLKLEPPKPTGNIEMNKTMMSTFKSSLTSQKKDVVKLFELGILDEQQAGSLINKIQNVYNGLPKTSGSSGGGKVSIRNVAPAKVTSLRAAKTAPIKLKAIKLGKQKTGLKPRQKRAVPKVSEAQLAQLRNPNLKS